MFLYRLSHYFHVIHSLEDYGLWQTVCSKDGHKISPNPIALLQRALDTVLGPRQALWLLWPIEYGNSDTAPVSGTALNWPSNIYFLLLISATFLRSPCYEKPKPHKEALGSEAPGGQQEKPRSIKTSDTWANTPPQKCRDRPDGPTWSQADRLPRGVLLKLLTCKTACK